MKKIRNRSYASLFFVFLFFVLFNQYSHAQVTIECPTGDRQICWSDSTTGSVVYKGGGPRTVIIKQ